MEVFLSARGMKEVCGNYAVVMESVPGASLMSSPSYSVENRFLSKGRKNKKKDVESGKHKKNEKNNQKHKDVYVRGEAL